MGNLSQGQSKQPPPQSPPNKLTKNIEEYINNYFKIMRHEEDIHDLKTKLFSDEFLNDYLFENNEGKKNLKIRVLFTPLESNFLNRMIGKIATEFGSTHLAIQIGDKVLHWFDTSFVFIKDKYRSRNVVSVFYPQKIKKGGEGEERELISEIEDNEENRKKIIKFVIHWNTHEIYGAVKNNCQYFCKQFLKVFNLEITFQDPQTKLFLEYLVTCGSPIPRVVVNKEIIEFKNHEELERWHEMNSELNSDKEYLLKSFHRAFHLNKDLVGNCFIGEQTCLLLKDGTQPINKKK
eukprot:TRINITY_DN5591_c0_g1_i1.p1 TRINITY_DN5591_c0_g1~~TRINITY_DN5591_c0_g1_i1.p1  ORF type:complete len:292 (-),score=62.84 TRINITY_DN5591_c0_g1_i1:23-898(-)